MSLKGKFRAIVAVAAFGLITLTAFWLRGERTRILAEKQDKTRNLVEVPYSLIMRFHQLAVEGRMSDEKARQSAIEAIGTLRYDNDNYFWINDLQPRMVMHPLKPELNGKDLSGFRDADQKTFFVDMVTVVQGQGAGFVGYKWPKPGKDAKVPVPKLSYVKVFRPWGWVIGTGIYIDDVDAAWREAATTAGIISTLCLIVLLSVAGSLSRSIFRRLQQVLERVDEVARGEGDLTKRIPIGSSDELAQLGQSFNAFMDKLQQMIREVRESAENMAGSAQQLAAASEELAAGTEEQVANLQQTTATLSQITSSVRMNAASAKHANEVAAESSEAAEKGGDAVDRTSAAMSDINGASRSIAEIIATIDEMAFQTNLLALNAAVEAARAGHEGRGFAVVASEVGALARRSAASAKEIHQLIGESCNKVEKGAALTDQSGVTLRHIVQSAKMVADIVAEITNASHEQSVSIEQINRTMLQMSQVTQNNSAQTEQLSATAQNLSSRAHQLQALVGRFRIDLSDHKAQATRPIFNASEATFPHHSRSRKTLQRQAAACQ